MHALKNINKHKINVKESKKANKKCLSLPFQRRVMRVYNKV